MFIKPSQCQPIGVGLLRQHSFIHSFIYQHLSTEYGNGLGDGVYSGKK